MAAKKVEVDERVIAVQAQMDERVYEIRLLDQEKEELDALLDKRIEQLKAAHAGKIEKIGNRREQLINELKALFDQVPHKETKTQAKVTLLSGDVVVKKPTLEFDYDKKVLLENAESTGLTEYIKIKEVKDFDWTGFKSKLEIQEDASIVNTETGEVVEIEGLSVLPKAEQVVIK